ncbi:MAG TPA: hypothetical protein VLA51_04080 [Paracoccaceae bacterium]|nr:hypothetical protein [Paracoccaceae bacterium]
MPVVPTHHYRETYSQADLAALAQEFSIAPDHRAEMASLLEDAAAIWRWHAAGYKVRTAPYIAAKNLREVSRQAEKLKVALDALPPLAVAALASQQESAQSSVITGTLDKGKMLGFMATESDGSEYPIFPDFFEIGQLITALADLANRAGNLPRAGKGKPTNHALRMWIANIEMFWTSTLGRSFSRDVGLKGEAISESARFCVAAFRFVSPETPENTVLNVQKNYISSVNRKSLAK